MDLLLRNIFLLTGVVMILAFLGTGQLMAMHDPPVSTLELGDRMMFVSRHIYILFSGLLCLGMGANFRLPVESGRRSMAMIGALLLPTSAVLLLLAFFVEPGRGRAGGLVSTLALFAAFGGVLLYAIACVRKDSTN